MLKGTKINTIDHDLAIHLYVEEQKSLKVVGKKLGVSPLVIKRIIKFYGFKIRSRSENQTIRHKRERQEKFGCEEEIKTKLTYLHHIKEFNLHRCAEELDTSYNTILRWMDKFGIKKRVNLSNPAKWEHLDAKEVIRLYTEEEKSMPQIGRIFGVSAPVVSRVLQHHNVPTRSISQAKAIWWEKKREKKLDKTVVLDVPKHLSMHEQIVHLRKNKDARIQDIATTVGCSNVDVYETLEEANLL